MAFSTALPLKNFSQKHKKPPINEGFNAQKRRGYCLEHQYSKNYQAQKNHYYLIQIGHMIAQRMEVWGKLWERIKENMKQHHRRLLESFKKVRLKECKKRTAEENTDAFRIEKDTDRWW